MEDLKEEKIVNKVGGRFKLSTLIQKRMVALNTGAKPLVDMKTTDKMAIVIEEILQDKIFLDQVGELQCRPNPSSIPTTVPFAGPKLPPPMPATRARDDD
jgi:DNA-directed RNA polymerase subunit omega